MQLNYVEVTQQGVVTKSSSEMITNGTDGRQVILEQQPSIQTDPTAPPVPSPVEVLSPVDVTSQLAGQLDMNPDGSINCRMPSQPGGCFVAGTLVHTKQGLVPIEQLKVGDWVLSKPEGGQGDQAYKRVTRTFKFEDKEVMLLEFFPVAEFERAKRTGGDVFEAIRNEAKQYLVATPNHPFWINGVGWTAAGDVDEYTLAGVPAFQLADGDLAHAGFSGPLYHTPLDQGIAWFAYGEETYGMIPVDLSRGETQADLKWSMLQPVRDRNMGAQYPDSLLRQTVYNIEVEDYHTYYVGTMGVWVHNTNCQTVEVTSSKQIVDFAGSTASLKINCTPTTRGGLGSLNCPGGSHCAQYLSDQLEIIPRHLPGMRDLG